VEAHRVLRKDGTLLICTPNRERPGFVRSPHSHRYFSAHELYQLLTEHGFSAELFGAFPASDATAKAKVISLARRVAVTLDLVPKTLKGRELLKRMVYGELQQLEAEVDEGMAELQPLVPLAGAKASPIFKVLYAMAHVV
jgi:hypothetical protein